MIEGKLSIDIRAASNAADAIRKFGVTMEEAEKAVKRLGEAAAKAKLREIADLSVSVRLLVIRVRYGSLRFLMPEYWRLRRAKRVIHRL